MERKSERMKQKYVEQKSEIYLKMVLEMENE